MEKVSKYLREGKMTRITLRVKKVANQIPGEGREFINELFNWIKDGGYFKRVADKDKKRLLDTESMQRTVDQILESRYTIACGEKTMVFITLCRVKGIPAKYVETVGLDFLKKKTDEHVHTHAFVEAYLQGKWVLIDPDAAKIYDKMDYKKCGYIKWAEGVDPRDLIGKEGRHYSWQNFNEFIRDALTFKRCWRITS